MVMGIAYGSTHPTHCSFSAYRQIERRPDCFQAFANCILSCLKLELDRAAK
jgi:hypothetical protein